MATETTMLWCNFYTGGTDAGPDFGDDRSVMQYIRDDAARSLYVCYRGLGASPTDALRRTLLASVGEADRTPITRAVE